MSNEKKPATETLETKGQPRDILTRIRPAFREHIRPLTRKQTGESLGGDSVLNARWDHRLSRDLHVHLQLATTEDRRAVLEIAVNGLPEKSLNAILTIYKETERQYDGAVEIETTTSEGTRTRRYDSAEALQAGLERDGVNAFLEAQERDAAAVLDATIDACG